MKIRLVSNKHVAWLTLLITVGAASISAQQSVNMKFSGTAQNSGVDIGYSSASYDQDNFAGTGSLGKFSLRNERALPTNLSTPPSTCLGSDLIYAVETSGAGVFRFEDGSLLYVNVTQGTDCINVVTNGTQCVLHYQITGGTGRFKNASGTLELTETAVSQLMDASGNAIYYAATGTITGEVSGLTDNWVQDADD